MPRAPWRLLAAATLLALTSCQRAPAPAAGPGTPTPRPTPAPHFTSVAAAGRAEILAYADSLKFDASMPAMDAQYLLVPRRGRLDVGPYAEVSPEIGAASITHDALTQGRILARLVMNQPYPVAGFPSGVTYVWIDSGSAGFQATLVPKTLTAPITHRPVTVTSPGNWPQGYPWARFVVLEDPPDTMPTMVTGTVCQVCNGKWCCY